MAWPRLIGELEYWPFSGIRVTDADDNDVDGATVVLTPVGSGADGDPLQPRDLVTELPVTLVTNASGNVGRFMLPAPAADVSADGITYETIGTSEFGLLVLSAAQAKADAETARLAAAGSATQVSELKTQVEELLANGAPDGGGTGTGGGVEWIAAVSGAWPYASLAAAVADGRDPDVPWVWDGDITPPSFSRNDRDIWLTA